MQYSTAQSVKFPSFYSYIYLLLLGHEEVEHEAVLREGLSLPEEHLEAAPAPGAVVCQGLVAAGPGARLYETVGDELLSVGAARPGQVRPGKRQGGARQGQGQGQGEGKTKSKKAKQGEGRGLV